MEKPIRAFRSWMFYIELAMSKRPPEPFRAFWHCASQTLRLEVLVRPSAPLYTLSSKLQDLGHCSVTRQFIPELGTPDNCFQGRFVMQSDPEQISYMNLSQLLTTKTFRIPVLEVFWWIGPRPAKPGSSKLIALKQPGSTRGFAFDLAKCSQT